MKAIQFDTVGAPLQVVDVDKPQPQKGQVLVKQRYSSINPMDHKINVTNAFKLPVPATLGYDLCGTVVELGEGVTDLQVGDEVFGQSTMLGKCFAEFIAVPSDFVVKRTTIPAKEAGGSTVVFGTAWFALFTEEDLATFDINAKKHQGKTIFIPGGGGGVGHLIVQLAKHSGYKVITSASKPESIQICKDCKADHVLDYSKQDVVAEVLKLTNNEGVDAVVDTTYSPTSFEQSASVVKKGGSWICVGNQWQAQHDAALKKCEERGAHAKHGDYGRYWFVPDYVKHAKTHIPYMLRACDALYAQGVRTRVSKVVPLIEIEQVREEVRAVGDSKRYGKIVIEIAGDK